MTALVIVYNKKSFPDPAAQSTMVLLRELGAGVTGVETAALYRLDANASAADLTRVAKDLLADPVTQECDVQNPPQPGVPQGGTGVTVDVWLKDHVTDPVAPSVERGAADLGVVLKARVGKRFTLQGTTDVEAATRVAWRALANPVLHTLNVRVN